MIMRTRAKVNKEIASKIVFHGDGFVVASPPVDDPFARALAAFDPAAPGATVLQDGRNLTVRAPLAGADAVVKRFPAPSFFRALLMRRAGTPPKATRSWLAARHLWERLPGSTPEPLAFLESGTTERPGPGLFATRYEPGLVSFTARLAALYAQNGPGPDLIALLERVAKACRALHDAGFFHGDLGNQNLQLAPDGRVLAVDLNRSRLFPGPVPPALRGRDLSRIALPSDFRRVFFEMYWGAPPPEEFLRAERRARRAFARHTATRRFRHPFRRRRPPVEPVYPAPRDIWIWDPRSEQALVTMRPKDRRRYMSLSRVWRPLLALLATGHEARRHRRALDATAFGRPVFGVANRVFVSLAADSSRFGGELVRLERLDCPGVHVRFYAHETDAQTDFKIAAVRRLRALGRAVAVSLVQDRAAVRDPRGRWLAFCDRVLGALHGELIWVEYLHAVNRVKWGIWTYRELRRLLALLPDLRARYRDVAFLAPSAIDFEWDFFAGALPLLPRRGGPLPGLSAELYVDRRGAPENKQGRFDAVGKIHWLRALAKARRGAAEDHLVVTEFNWPLAGTGVWSPVGAPWVSPGPRFNDPSVSEGDAAAFSLRYLLLGVCSGAASSMVFWSLCARGFGLVDPGEEPGGEWRERPAFAALRFFFAALRHGSFADAPLRSGDRGVWLLRFEDRNGRRLAVAWATGPEPLLLPSPAPLGFAPRDVRAMDGSPADPAAPLTGAPRYFFEDAAPAL